MSTYTLPDLLKHWKLGEMTAEQAAPKGHPHLLQHLVALVQLQAETEKRLRQLEQTPVPTQAVGNWQAITISAKPLQQIQKTADLSVWVSGMVAMRKSHF